MNNSRIVCWTAAAVCLMAMFVSTATAYPSAPGYYYGSNEIDIPYDQEDIENAINYLSERRAGAAAKRGLDFGMSRGVAGALSAKHMMGLAAAYGGPGKRSDPYNYNQ